MEHKIKQPEAEEKAGIRAGDEGQPERGSARTSWLQGAAVLGAAAALSKLLGTIQKVPLQNIAGDRVFGLYNAVYPFYQLLLFLTAAGIPAALSLLVAERVEKGDSGQGLVRAAMVWLAISAAAGFALMWFGAGAVALMVGDELARPAIRASALALFSMPFVAALRGYFQGRQRMLPSAVSQVTEQSFRVAAMLTLLLLGWSWGWSDAMLAAGATAGSAVGGAAGLAVMLLFWLAERRSGRLSLESGAAAALKRSRDVERDGRAERFHKCREASRVRQARKNSLGPDMGLLLRVGLPAAFGAAAVPVAGIVDAFTVPRLLSGDGMSAMEAMRQFGLYSRGQTLVQLVVMVAGTMAGALVPALAAARLRGDREAVKGQAGLALGLAWQVGAAAAVGLVLLAPSINIMLYTDNEAGRTFAWVSATALAGTLSAVTAAMLPALGRVKLPALLILGSAACKAGLNAVLVPAFGIEGAAWAGFAALSAAALLGAGAVRRAAGGGPAVPRAAAGTALALACMAAALLLTERGLPALLGLWPLPLRAAAAVHALTGTAVGAVVFAAALVLGGGIGARELRALPGGSKLAALLHRNSRI
ncbi:putative polysaccharide biosynthesis protein [Paenibacillus tarimensis]|uniref:putative polysaccharide biosynthesis protein n=1 Tax=Paenibacillus tarimensis TaxID=416012 RepID=UPI001F217BE6|nr:polysaccharide biosynthesis protein [Paenibacillus tarimensis]MCF2946209.1 polysaccharide biosynthesis protein [Paenibacillus tarimensis]